MKTLELEQNLEAGSRVYGECNALRRDWIDQVWFLWSREDFNESGIQRLQYTKMRCIVKAGDRGFKEEEI